MKKFEYTIRTEGSHVIGRRDQRIDFLNKLGEDGWELTGVVHNLFIDGTFGVASFDFYFKRLLK